MSPRQRRVSILSILGSLVASYFWFGSRYPQLNEKAMMAESESVADLMSAWPILPVAIQDPYWKKVLFTTLNWANDNTTGMFIGIFFGALFLTMFSYFRQVNTSNRFLNTIYGFVIGTPLGVCVNCAAPIFKGMLQSRRVETAFSMMLSSPTMNFVVLTMTFTLFPLYMAVTKVVFTFLVVFLGVPIISKLLGDGHEVKDIAKLEEGQSAQLFEEKLLKDRSWIDSCRGTLQDFAKSFVFIGIRTVPLMFIAGGLGSAMSHGFEVEALQRELGPAGIAVLALVSSLVPMPMAFDVVLTNALFSAGLPAHVALILLCTLGIFSVFSYMIIWQSASKKWANSLLALICSMAVVLGLSSQSFHRLFYLEPNIADFAELNLKFGEHVDSAIDRYSVMPPPDRKSRNALPWQKMVDNQSVKILARPFYRRPLVGSEKFRKLEGHEIGLNHGFRFGILELPEPFWHGRGTASGDFNGDGWQDIAFGTSVGISLFANHGGHFKRVTLPQKFIAAQKVFAVAFVDMDNDGWLDLFFTTYLNGNYILKNQGGSFEKSQPLKVPNNSAIVTMSPGFADINGNGFLDVVNGNIAFSLATAKRRFSKKRSNSVTYNENLKFKNELFKEESGETLASLVSDLNGDRRPDVYFGNDFIVPDRLYLLGDNGFEKIQRSYGFLRTTPHYTMGIDSGDFNNDGLLDLSITGTIEALVDIDAKEIDGVKFREFSVNKSDVSYCDKIKDNVVRKNCKIMRKTKHRLPVEARRRLKVKDCLEIENVESRHACWISTMWMITTYNEIRNCRKDFKGSDLLMHTCLLLNERGKLYERKDFWSDLHQSNRNILYRAEKGGKFVMMKKADYPHPGGWTWSSKFADLDNDGWLDIFTAEGAVRNRAFGWNVYLKNIEGKRFESKQFSANLTDDFELFSFTFVDVENDGDLDIVGNSSVGPVQVYLNQSSSKNRSFAVELRDSQGNRFGVGAKVGIRTDSGQIMTREIKASGGYQSFDAPIAYFGIGSGEKVEKLEIIWQQGPPTRISGPFPADAHYLIERKQ